VMYLNSHLHLERPSRGRDSDLTFRILSLTLDLVLLLANPKSLGNPQFGSRSASLVPEDTRTTLKKLRFSRILESLRESEQP
jgi:hypothetical protein